MSQGYSRLGSALYSLGRFDEAIEAYEKGISYDPTNAQMKEALEDCKNQMRGGFRGSNGFENLFSDPESIVKLATDPRTRPFLNDPEYMEMLEKLQKNPESVQYVF